MELVSLLKHASPQVYVSKNLPSMENATEHARRSLDQFEAAALARIQDGEDIIIDARANRIMMVGAIRAENRCKACHKVQRGEALGAFTYEILRRKPIAPSPAPRTPTG